MKALLVESKNLRKMNHRSAIILLPSGKLELEPGDPISIAIELIDGDLWVKTITANDFAELRVIKEIEVADRLFLKALQYRSARANYEDEKVKFQDYLLNEIIDSRCDAFTFLDMGSIVL